MIIHFAPGGRLGNQLFEIAFIENVRRSNEVIFLHRLVDGKRLLRGLRRYMNVENWIMTNLIDHVIQPLIRYCALHCRLLCYIIEDENGEARVKGLLPITYIEGYFQSERHVKGRLLKIKRHHEGVAREIYRRTGDRTPVFVHVRRGDYLTFSMREPSNPFLEEAYYRSAMSLIGNAVARPY